jgi:putative ABC transport system permease protein
VILVALRGLAGRKFRAIATALAIVLGVAMVSGTFVLTDTIDKAFSTIFSESYAGTDAVVSAKSADITFQGDQADTEPIPESTLDAVRGVSSVEAAAGSIVDMTATKIIGSDGKAIDTSGAPSFGFGIDPSPELSRFNPLNILDGRWPSGPNEVVVDVGTADDQHFDLGQTIEIATLQPVQSFKLVGIARYGSVDSLGSATFAVFDIPTAQKLLDRPGQFDAIAVAAKPGVTQEELVRDLDRALPPTVEAKTGREEAQKASDDISEFTKIIRYFLLAFGAIALFVGAFVIFNTLSITVAQRTREFATLRTIGASRRQLLTSVIVEALVIGIVASVLGLLLGFALARGINALFVALNADLPTTAQVYAPRTFVVSILIGVVVTVLAGLAPAIRATRVPPIAAVREGAELPHGRLARYVPYIAAVLVALAVVLLGYAMFADSLDTGPRLISIAMGVLLLFVGVAMLSKLAVPPVARAIGFPSARLGGVAGSLARGNALRNPSRTAATAAALMIGLALVTFIATLSAGMKASNRDAIEAQVVADYVVTSQNGFDPFVAAAGDAASQASVSQQATSVRSDLAKFAGTSGYLTGIEPGSIANAYRFDWKDGSGSDEVLSQLGNDGAIISNDFADKKDLAVGDRFPLLVPSGQRRTLVVRGIYEPPPFYPLLGTVSIAKATFDSLFERPRNQFTFINVAGDPTEATQNELEASLAGFPDAKVQTREAWITAQDEDFNQFLIMLYVLLTLSVLVSLFGMVNTLVLSVFERTRELGMLRAVGMTRRQTRRMIRHESVITALIGAALGLPLGILLATLVTRALSEFDVQYKLPWGQLIVFVIVAIIAGILAAIIPARRASRLRVLEALQYE